MVRLWRVNRRPAWSISDHQGNSGKAFLFAFETKHKGAHDSRKITTPEYTPNVNKQETSFSFIIYSLHEILFALLHQEGWNVG